MKDTTRRARQRATVVRSATLLNHFRYEQSDPDRFYGALADDSVELIEALHRGVTGLDPGGPAGLDRKVVLDVGGGPGYFAEVFRRRGAHYVSVEPDPDEMHAAGLPQQAGVRGSGTALPIADAVVDICYSSNVAEHVAEPWSMAREMLRVTRPGGLVLLSYTLWYGPFGGHEMGLTHYFGGARAARWYTRKHGHRPKNLYGTSLFKVTAADGLRWARSVPPSEATLVAAFPRYLPGRLWWVMKVPLIREVLGTNLVLLLRKADPTNPL
ncbi:class I SAM-dependent methyltransferase [Williamsia sp. DF01-3]|uniref:class I SAM-dependent methyltransferase n=1 Tax=Williamsia sp. DF01-3 TaxID=2934157 RepID=UPI001FF13E51|nr:class I SAM-dependent methyltransferase [Williamsia sp. DF01-3]MCK0520417.1 class I SAM-dependent methyltransferase [Williamsia sp. DF01-3]